jgi:hypothetical protein
MQMLQRLVTAVLVDSHFADGVDELEVRVSLKLDWAPLACFVQFWNGVKSNAFLKCLVTAMRGN